ncbi:DUF2314 domain-containing protein [Erythrobacter ani]|uniref:DUF2314 domain-containing protein n=1 Tax=Erythrobacter ani TaxID=2827235 RepID=A0ABS6SJC8_9SPHN|nr:DUF2314 domain-containing protein [Erythrobacter ani]MBV7264578.1 DUF2314 domain-containing protein [Erythrobacter ani]
MARATQKALQTIDRFWEHYNDPAEDEDDFALKIRMPIEDGNEQIWVGEISNRNGRWLGRLLNEPVSGEFQIYQTVEFEPDQICDWTYAKADVLEGNFSLAVMLSELPEKKRQRALSDFGWSSNDLELRVS